MSRNLCVCALYRRSDFRVEGNLVFGSYEMLHLQTFNEQNFGCSFQMVWQQDNYCNIDQHLVLTREN